MDTIVAYIIIGLFLIYTSYKLYKIIDSFDDGYSFISVSSQQKQQHLVSYYLTQEKVVVCNT